MPVPLDYQQPTRKPRGAIIILTVQSLLALASIVYAVMGIGIARDVYAPYFGVLVGLPVTALEIVACIAPAQFYLANHRSILSSAQIRWMHALSIVPPAIATITTLIVFVTPHTQGSRC